LSIREHADLHLAVRLFGDLVDRLDQTNVDRMGVRYVRADFLRESPALRAGSLAAQADQGDGADGACCFENGSTIDLHAGVSISGIVIGFRAMP